MSSFRVLRDFRLLSEISCAERNFAERAQIVPRTFFGAFVLFIGQLLKEFRKISSSKVGTCASIFYVWH